MRHYGIDYWDNPHNQCNILCIDINREAIINLTLDATKVLFQSRAPAQKKSDTCDCIEMNSCLRWNPHDVKLGETSAPSKSILNIMTDSDKFLKSINPSLIILKEISTRHI